MADVVNTLIICAGCGIAAVISANDSAPDVPGPTGPTKVQDHFSVRKLNMIDTKLCSDCYGDLVENADYDFDFDA